LTDVRPDPTWRERLSEGARRAVCAVVRHWWRSSPVSSNARCCRICGLTEVWLKRIPIVENTTIVFDAPPDCGRMNVYYKDIDGKRFDALKRMKERVADDIAKSLAIPEEKLNGNQGRSPWTL